MHKPAKISGTLSSSGTQPHSRTGRHPPAAAEPTRPAPQRTLTSWAPAGKARRLLYETRSRLPSPRGTPEGWPPIPRSRTEHYGSTMAAPLPAAPRLRLSAHQGLPANACTPGKLQLKRHLLTKAPTDVHSVGRRPGAAASDVTHSLVVPSASPLK